MQLQINLQLILDFNLENFTGKTTLMVVMAGIAVIHRPLRLCMHNIIHMYGFFKQVVVAYTLMIKVFGRNLDEKLAFVGEFLDN